MKQEDKDHLLNDRGLSPEQQDEVRGLFARLDLMGVSYRPLSIPLRDLIPDCAFEPDPSGLVPELQEFAKRDTESKLNRIIEFDIYIPSKGWVLNVNHQAFEGRGNAQSILLNTFRSSFKVVGDIRDEYWGGLTCDSAVDIFTKWAKDYCYPTNSEGKLILWSKSLAEEYKSAHKNGPQPSEIVITDWHLFYKELNPDKVEELQEKRFQKFLANNPFWKEHYVRFAAALSLKENSHQSRYTCGRKFKEAKEFVIAGNPDVDFDFDDIID
jgi:hypothetical protein